MNHHSSPPEMISFSFSGKTYRTSRVIGSLGNAKGTTVVFVGGMHGNEPTGAIAILEVFEELQASGVSWNGRMVGFVGNLAALELGQRFVEEDLNRIWNQGFLKSREAELVAPTGTEHSSVALAHEKLERRELFDLIEPLLDAASDPSTPGGLVFADLHTTSARSMPFIAINDQIANRQFALKFPVPTVLGIEEYLEGPLLSMLNDEGHIAMAFEAGQHDDPISLELHKAFIYCTLVNAGVINGDDVSFARHRTRLKEKGDIKRGIFEVVYRKPVASGDEFVMKPGFENFSEIKQGELLANDKGGAIEAHRSGKIFMPLYQSTGNDGYFIVKEVPQWALRLSRWLRRMNFESLLVLLPGVSRSKAQVDALVVNKKVARFLAVQLFHLLGYRRKQDDGATMIVSRREIERE